jgi:hypothetical protein
MCTNVHVTAITPKERPLGNSRHNRGRRCGQHRAGQIRLQAGAGTFSRLVLQLRRGLQLHLDLDRGVPAVLLGFASGGPAFIWTWPLVFLGQLAVALCFAEMAGQFPLAGSVYQ